MDTGHDFAAALKSKRGMADFYRGEAARHALARERLLVAYGEGEAAQSALWKVEHAQTQLAIEAACVAALEMALEAASRKAACASLGKIEGLPAGGLAKLAETLCMTPIPGAAPEEHDHA